jgi:polysaccharide pyruvyl transferase WcaK-like protein
LKIGVTGWFGHGNPGDDLLLNNFLKAYSRSEVIVFTTDITSAKDVAKRFELKTYTIKEVPDVDVDALFFGGGGFLHDIAIEVHFPKKLIDKIYCPILLVGMGIPHGERNTLISHRINYFIDKVCFFGFRDYVSKFIFDSFWDKSSHVVPDLAFLTKKVKLERTDEILLQRKQRIPSNFINLTPTNYNKISAAQFDLLYKKLKLHKYRIRFLEWQSFDEVINEIAKARWIVTNSLHAGIIALTQSTPFSAIAYQGKVNDVLSIVANKNRLIYPSKVHKVEKFIPPLVYSTDEQENLIKIQTYLQRSLSQIHKALEKNRLNNLKLEEFPIKISFKKEKYFYGRVKPRFSRRIINQFKKLYAS